VPEVGRVLLHSAAYEPAAATGRFWRAASWVSGECTMKSKVPTKNVKLKRAYDEPVAADEMRILVDRLWPRGVKKEAAAIDLWAKDLAPSTELRKWFGHDPARWAEFERRYTTEVAFAATCFASLKVRPACWTRNVP
jgi:uncharacterized protein YeaO (DUF488 family)